MQDSYNKIDKIDMNRTQDNIETSEHNRFYTIKPYESISKCQYYLRDQISDSNAPQKQNNNYGLNLCVFSQGQLNLQSPINQLASKNNSNFATSDETNNSTVAFKTVKPICKKSKIRSKRRQFTQFDDQKLLKYILQHGPKFEKIQRHFPGKTSSMLKNRYYKHLRYHWGQLIEEKQKTLDTPSPVDDLRNSLNTLNLCQEAKAIMVNFLNWLA